jgi:hypothetical protein
MAYLLLAYHKEKAWDALSKCERDAVLGECRSHDEALGRAVT